MDPSQRMRKAPPLPKFKETAQAEQNVKDKVTDFLQQISKVRGPIPEIQTIPVPAPVEQKKKFNMASLNSKLNSIMSSKKIDMNKVVQNSKKNETMIKKQVQIDYDPANPNSYEQCKYHYLPIFEKLRNSTLQTQQDLDTIISKMIAEFDKDDKEQQQQQQIQTKTINDGNYLDNRESLALRMMQKYGFKVGQGLGKQSQGIRTPLTIKKLTDSSCRIQLSSVSLTNLIGLEQSVENMLLALKINKSPVVALCIPMELETLTDQVELEIKEECHKFGEIVGWIAVFNNKQILFYCKYQSIQSAFKTFVKVNGRYYDERIIRVFFYDLNLFDRGDYSGKFHQLVEF